MNTADFVNSFLFKTHKSPIKLLLRMMGVFLLFDVILLLLFSFINFIEIKKAWFIPFFNYEENVVILFLLLYIIVFILFFFLWFVNYYEIKNGNIFQYNGVFFKKKEVYIIADINRLEINQTFLWRIFDYWDIIIWYNDNRVTFRFIQYPNQFLNNLQIIKTLTKISQ